MVARRAHNPKVTGSSPVPATKKERSSAVATFSFFGKIPTRKLDYIAIWIDPLEIICYQVFQDVFQVQEF